MDFARLYLSVLVAISVFACSGCSESSAFIDYASLEALAADFEPGANPAFQVDGLGRSSADDLVATSPPSESPTAVVDSSTADSAGEDVAATITSVGAEESPNETVVAVNPAVAMQDSGDDSTDSADAKAVEDDSTEAEVAASEPSLLGTDPMAVQKPSEPREIKLLIPEKRLRAEGEGTLRVSYDDIDLLKILNMEPVPVGAEKHFPEWLKQLDGQRIRIRGFMYPTFEATGLQGFTLARDNGICCFVRQPMIYDIIGVSLAKGVTTDYIDNKPFDVEGVFQIEPEADDMELYQLYRITDAKVLN